MRALHKMNPKQAGEAYCTPYAFNLRKNKALSPLLSNHVAPLFAQHTGYGVNNSSNIF
jgi:hypothetical protein